MSKVDKIQKPTRSRVALKTIEKILGNPKYFNKPIEIGGEEVVTYMDVLKLLPKK